MSLRCIRSLNISRRWNIFAGIHSTANKQGPLSSVDNLVDITTHRTDIETNADHPMKVLSNIFKVNKRAVLQHRELITSLANGDDESAADIAKILAQTIKEWKEKNKTVELASKNRDDQSLIPNGSSRSTAENITGTSSKADECDPVDPSASNSNQMWMSPENLRITILESLFETEDRSEPFTEVPAPSSSAEESNSHLHVLNSYLQEEEKQWRQQKHMLAAILLRIAKWTHLTPLDLHGCEAPKEESPDRFGLNPVRHANVVIRGEVPDVLDYRNPALSAELEELCQRDLNSLKKRMLDEGTPLNATEEVMALYELRRTKTVMRYSIGIHRDLQNALDTSPTVRSALEKLAVSGKPSELFVSTVIRLLNQSADERNPVDPVVVKEEEAVRIERPVIPFTFMLKCCLWFELV